MACRQAEVETRTADLYEGLIAALRLKIAEIAPDGRSIDEHLIDVLLQEALRGKHRLPAVEVIFDRLEGRAIQALHVADITRGLREKSDEELRFHRSMIAGRQKMNCGCLQKPKNHHRCGNSGTVRF